ncbi:MAG: hypothetical protein OEM83_03440 [Gammaproteobacteria bacterium]|nr:hypothetical protein [Gammaproteobacteria bacterium]
MRYMQDLMARMMDVPLAHMFVLAALLFLLVAVLGRIEGKIEPGSAGRIGATLIGIVLMFAGMAMHFNETDALRDRMRDSLSTASSAPAHQPGEVPGGTVVRFAAASQNNSGMTDKAGAVATPGGVAAAVKVITGTYGGNCGAKPGNATAQIARVCDGQIRCEYRIDPVALENLSPKCARNFSAEWTCGVSGAVYTVSIPAGALPGEPLRLACSPQ